MGYLDFFGILSLGISFETPSWGLVGDLRPLCRCAVSCLSVFFFGKDLFCFASPLLRIVIIMLSDDDQRRLAEMCPDKVMVRLVKSKASSLKSIDKNR